MKNAVKLFAFLAIALLGGSFVSCSDDDSASTKLTVRLTDAPAALDEVNIDLREVKVNFRDDSSGWTTVTTTPGMYNLLDYQNEIDTMIARGTFPTGVLKEIRLVLGTNNSVVVDGKEFPLTIPSGAESGLKIKVNKKLAEGSDAVLLDFDATLSVKEEDGGYKLRPVIKIKETTKKK